MVLNNHGVCNSVSLLNYKIVAIYLLRYVCVLVLKAGGSAMAIMAVAMCSRLLLYIKCLDT